MECYFCATCRSGLSNFDAVSTNTCTMRGMLLLLVKCSCLSNLSNTSFSVLNDMYRCQQVNCHNVSKSAPSFSSQSPFHSQFSAVRSVGSTCKILSFGTCIFNCAKSPRAITSAQMFSSQCAHRLFKQISEGPRNEVQVVRQPAGR
jgi:hypothetical protein